MYRPVPTKLLFSLYVIVLQWMILAQPGVSVSDNVTTTSFLTSVSTLNTSPYPGVSVITNGINGLTVTTSKRNGNMKDVNAPLNHGGSVESNEASETKTPEGSRDNTNATPLENSLGTLESSLAKLKDLFNFNTLWNPTRDNTTTSDKSNCIQIGGRIAFDWVTYPTKKKIVSQNMISVKQDYEWDRQCNAKSSTQTIRASKFTPFASINVYDLEFVFEKTKHQNLSKNHNSSVSRLQTEEDYYLRNITLTVRAEDKDLRSYTFLSDGDGDKFNKLFRKRSGYNYFYCERFLLLILSDEFGYTRNIYLYNFKFVAFNNDNNDDTNGGDGFYGNPSLCPSEDELDGDGGGGGSLSTGVIIGISVGCVAFVVLVAYTVVAIRKRSWKICAEGMEAVKDIVENAGEAIN